MKTRVVSEAPSKNTRAKHRYEVRVLTIFAPDDVPPGLEDLEARDSDDAGARRTKPKRQLHRMSKAIAVRTTAPGKITTLPGIGNFLVAQLDGPSHPAHWKDLRRIIRKARAAGYAAAAIDNAMIYVAVYNKDGLGAGALEGYDLASDVISSGILDLTDQRFRNTLGIYEVPPRPDHVVARYFLPHFLYDVPQRAITDILYERLVIFVLINPARLVDALTVTGLIVHMTHEDKFRVELIKPAISVHRRQRRGPEHVAYWLRLVRLRVGPRV